MKLRLYHDTRSPLRSLKNGGSNPSDIINQIIKDYEEILRISHRTFEQGSQR